MKLMKLDPAKFNLPGLKAIEAEVQYIAFPVLRVVYPAQRLRQTLSLDQRRQFKRRAAAADCPLTGHISDWTGHDPADGGSPTIVVFAAIGLDSLRALDRTAGGLGEARDQRFDLSHLAVDGLGQPVQAMTAHELQCPVFRALYPVQGWGTGNPFDVTGAQLRQFGFKVARVVGPLKYTPRRWSMKTLMPDGEVVAGAFPRRGQGQVCASLYARLDALEFDHSAGGLGEAVEALLS